MKEEYCRYFVDAVKEVDIHSVASALDLQVVRKGMYDFIPCPGHLSKTGRIDRNATNAKLCDNPKGYYCFACGEFVPMIDMVQEVLGCDFNAAVNFIGDNCGVCPKEKGDTAIKRTTLTLDERDLLQLPNQTDVTKYLIGISTTEPLIRRGETFVKKGKFYYIYKPEKGYNLHRLYNENRAFYNNFIKWTKVHRKNYFKKISSKLTNGEYDEILKELFDDFDEAKKSLSDIYANKISRIEKIEEN